MKNAEPGWVDRTLLRFGTAGEFLGMLWRHRLGWLLPAAALLLLVGILFVVASTFQFAAPFFYALF